MISRKELQYVSSWPTKVPYPGYDYSRETLLELKKAILKYQEIYNGIKYNIVLSNSEEITLGILSKNLAHMLGIDYKNLMNEYRVAFRKQALDLDESVTSVGSYNLLQLIVENMDRVLDYEDTTGNLNLNFYKIRVKCEIFAKMAQLMDFNFGCINFNRDMFNSKEGRNFTGNSSKFLFTPSNEVMVPYFMMGIMKDNIESRTQEDMYVVETLFAPMNAMDYFKAQEVIIPTQILYDAKDNLTKKSATIEQKKKLISIYSEIIARYGLENRLNIFGDYMDLLTKEESFQKTL